MASSQHRQSAPLLNDGELKRGAVSKGESTVGHFFAFLPTPSEIACSLEAAAQEKQRQPFAATAVGLSRQPQAI